MANQEFSILTPRTTQALLDKLSHRPQKKWGQNFLIDGNIVRKSITFAELNSNDRVVEVGPGLGTLTQALLVSGAHVYAIERDPTLAKYLRTDIQPAFQGRLHLQEGDAMDFPRGLLDEKHDANFKIVANLPYAISTPWLELILQGPLPERMVLMLQKEAADRYLADAGTKSYGAITIFIKSAYDVVECYKVSKNCFYPVPKVDSALLYIKLKSQPFKFKPETRSLIRDIFTQRRKQIGALVKKQNRDLSNWLSSLTQLDLSEKSRPEEIPIEGWMFLDKNI